MATKAANEEETRQTTAVTNYLVQVKRTLYEYEVADEAVTGEVEAWMDLGNYEAPSGNRRKAIEQAMVEHGIEEGSFHTIPETSQAIEKCRIERKLVWS